MNEKLGTSVNLVLESAGDDFLGSALTFAESTPLWKRGLEIIRREGIIDKVFHAHPGIFSRMLATQGSFNTPRHFDGKPARSFYEVFLLDFLGLVTFERQQQMNADRKEGIHFESSEARSMSTLESKIIGEIQRVRKISGKLRIRAIPIITGRKSSGVVARITAQTEKITRTK